MTTWIWPKTLSNTLSPTSWSIVLADLEELFAHFINKDLMMHLEVIANAAIRPLAL